MNGQFEKDAIQIASHIRNNDLNVASELFSEKINDLKHWEAVALRSRITVLSEMPQHEWVKATHTEMI